MKVKLIDKKGWEKITEIKGKLPLIIKYPLITSKDILFRLFDIPKKGLPIFKEIIENKKIK